MILGYGVHVFGCVYIRKPFKNYAMGAAQEMSKRQKKKITEYPSAPISVLNYATGQCTNVGGR